MASEAGEYVLLTETEGNRSLSREKLAEHVQDFWRNDDAPDLRQARIDGLGYVGEPSSVRRDHDQPVLIFLQIYAVHEVSRFIIRYGKDHGRPRPGEHPLK